MPESVSPNLTVQGALPWWYRLLFRLFKWETMSGNGACPVYLVRWTLFRCPWFQIYLHQFLGDDWAIDPHNHPKTFISVGLWGWYVEEVYSPTDGAKLSERTYRAPWIRKFPASYTHRIRAAECGNTWTLVAVYRRSREWGFYREGKWMSWKKYVFGGKGRKSCP